MSVTTRSELEISRQALTEERERLRKPCLMPDGEIDVAREDQRAARYTEISDQIVAIDQQLKLLLPERQAEVESPDVIEEIIAEKRERLDEIIESMRGAVGSIESERSRHLAWNDLQEDEELLNDLFYGWMIWMRT